MSVLSAQSASVEGNPAIPHREANAKCDPRWTYPYRGLVSTIHWSHDPENYSAGMNVLALLGIKPKRRAVIFQRVVARGHSAAFLRNELDGVTARLWYQFLALTHNDHEWIDEFLEASDWYRECLHRLSFSDISDDWLQQIQKIALRFKSREAFLKATWNGTKIPEEVHEEFKQWRAASKAGRKAQRAE
jgi:hypothetical protein